ncbi:hypothetical protein FORC066_1406 [Yersinia enterocolitica]|nr:hypothetical protein FORC066_1406 [Yersinia enterocolitica]
MQARCTFFVANRTQDVRAKLAGDNLLIDLGYGKVSPYFFMLCLIYKA